MSIPTRLICGILLAFATATATAAESAGENPNRWKNAVIYQIYPRSFQDFNGVGIGDSRQTGSAGSYPTQPQACRTIWSSELVSSFAFNKSCGSPK